MMWAILGPVALLYEAVILCLLITRNPAPAPQRDPEDDIRTVLMTRIILPPRELPAADRARAKWALAARDVVALDAARWPHLVPAWQDEIGTFSRAVLEDVRAETWMAVAA